MSGLDYEPGAARLLHALLARGLRADAIPAAAGLCNALARAAQSAAPELAASSLDAFAALLDEAASEFGSLATDHDEEASWR